MALTVSPTSPYVGFDDLVPITPLTVTCSDPGDPGDPVPITDPPTPPNPDVPGPAVIILSATCVDSGITVSHTTTAFTVSGQFNDVFPRTLDYLNIDKLSEVASKFNDIPIDFSTLYRYVAPTEVTKNAIINVTFQNHSVISYAITIRNNWQSANAMLKAVVPKGAF